MYIHDIPEAESGGQASVIVFVEEAHRAQVDEVVKSLLSAGLGVTHIMPQVGLIAGECRPERFDELRKVRGVASVEPDLLATIPPLDGDPQ